MDRGSKATLPLTIPHFVFKLSANDSALRTVRITLQTGSHGPWEQHALRAAVRHFLYVA